MRKECSVKEGKALVCHECGQGGSTLRKDSLGYVHSPNCPPIHHKPVMTIPTAKELFAMRQPVREE